MRNRIFARHEDSELDADLDLETVVWFAVGAAVGYLVGQRTESAGVPAPAPVVAGLQKRERIIEAEIVEDKSSLPD